MKKRIVDYCSECDEPIYEEDKILYAGDKVLCEDCVAEMDSNDWIDVFKLNWEEAHYYEGARDDV